MPVNLNPNNTLACPNQASLRALLFEYSKMTIVNGANSLAQIDLKDFFIPLEVYNLQEIKLAAGTEKSIDPCGIGDAAGQVQFLAVVVDYPRFDDSNLEIPTVDKYLQWVYPNNGTTFNLGKIMMLSGTTAPGLGWDMLGSPGGFKLVNPHTNFDVVVKIMMFN